MPEFRTFTRDICAAVAERDLREGHEEPEVHRRPNMSTALSYEIQDLVDSASVDAHEIRRGVLLKATRRT